LVYSQSIEVFFTFRDGLEMFIEPLSLSQNKPNVVLLHHNIYYI
jgi:hypothetical protein